MQHVAAIVGHDIACMAGCGAAGGIPALMMHLLSCELLPGAPYVLEHSGLSDILTDADLVITGEGCLDRQTFMGKAPGHVIALAHERGIDVAAVCGIIAPDFDPEQAGLLATIAVSEGIPFESAINTNDTLQRVANAVRNLLNTLTDGHPKKT